MKQPFPGVITGIEAQARTRKHLGQRVNVFINDRFSFAIDAELVSRHNLRPGLSISKALLDALLREDGDAKAYAKALHFLGYRPRSEREVRERLKRDEWPDEVIERTLKRLRKEGALNDAHFASLWVENRTLSRPRGAYALQQELRQKGVAREEIAAALPDAESESENALAALQGRARQWERLEGRDREQKMLQFLQRRGFNFSVARVALRRFDEEEVT